MLDEREVDEEHLNYYYYYYGKTTMRQSVLVAVGIVYRKRLEIKQINADWGSIR